MNSVSGLLQNNPRLTGMFAKTSMIAGLGVGAATVIALPAVAIDFDWNNGAISGSFDTTVSTGVSARTQGHDHRLIGVNNGGTANSINGDNGNLNYEKGDITSANVKATHELSLNAGDFGFFGRASYFYDTAIMDGETARTNLGDEAKGRAGQDFELLDAYVYGDFDVGDVPVTVRVGNQVLSWGESTFIQNGINTINPIDVTKFRVAGAEIREGLVPVPIIDVNVGLTDKLSIEGFLQLEWDNTEIEPEGTFFSTNDFASPGGQFVFLGFGQPPLPTDNPPTIAANAPVGTTIPRGPDRSGTDNNQWGVALRYFEPELNDTEFGLYYIQYNSRLPVLSARTGTLAGLGGGNYAGSAQFFREFPDDIKLIGASFNTEIPGTGIALQGEYSFRKDQPLQVDDVELLFAGLSPIPATPFGTQGQLGAFGFDEEISGFRRKDVSQAQATASKVLGPTFGADQIVLVGEVGGTYVHDMENKSELRYEGPGTFTSGNSFFTGAGLQPATQDGGFADAFSWGYRLRARAEFNNAIGPVNLQPGIAFSHDVSGTTPSPLSNFVEDRKTVTLSLGATYLDSLRASIAYTSFFGGGAFNLLNDRDFASFVVSYSF
ncbi:DUF1302 domain-containing protein [Pelagibius sp. Alg239-R121]|uniref:DUF1302 domain-containing protein n=1 Tax=Pelagibius sp. Alg239-R121 TaxID=2993448 RepID=UPI0024A76411|nr:DUF1302 domain-containing protein [Pelagibius sp. Alg239-R121]